MHWRSELLQSLQEVRTICKTRNQLIAMTNPARTGATRAVPAVPPWEGRMYLLRTLLAPLSRAREFHCTDQHRGQLDPQCAVCQALEETYQAVVTMTDRLAP